MSETELGRQISRVIKGGFFPTSPAATLREAIFSEILAGVLGASPTTTELDELKANLDSHNAIDDDELSDQVWEVFEKTYTTTGARGARGKKAKRYIVPFHPEIAKRVRPHETRNWGEWYRMLMTSGDPPEFNSKLHGQFVDRIETLEPSNLFEQLIVDVATQLEYDEVETATEPLPPYIDDNARVFQSDLQRWLDDKYDSPSNWLQSARDLFCFHFMMYFVQLAINLEEEFSRAADDRIQSFEPEMRPVYFGMWDETASNDRQFTREWRERDERGIEGHVYDSWGRLAVLNEIAKVFNADGDRNSGTVTLSDALKLPEEVQQEFVDRLKSELPEEGRTRSNDLSTVANIFAREVRYYYESRSRANQTPITMGINVVRQLGDGGERMYWRTQRKIGPTFRLNRGALRLFARLFAMNADDTHYDEFVKYLQQRGVFLDSQSETSALEELDEMGMIDRQSDSGGAVYVRSL
jgi:DNA phosphorothioation-dependent restriction protein DptG